MLGLQAQRAGRAELSVASRDSRDYDKWSATVEIEAAQRDGYLPVWSSGELDTQVLREPEFLVLNEHRLVESVADLETGVGDLRGGRDLCRPARGERLNAQAPRRNGALVSAVGSADC